MKIVLSGRGSRGDIYPIIEIALALKKENHIVCLCVPKYFKEYCEKRGITPNFLYSEDTLSLMKGFGHGWKSFKSVMKWFSSAVDEQFEFLLKETEDADLLITGATEVAVPTVAKFRNVPYLRIAYAPILPGNHPPPLVPWQNLPDFGNRIMWGLLNFGTGTFIKKFLNKKRKSLNMHPIGQIADYFTRNSFTVLAINSLLAPECPSWTKKHNYDFQYTGYCYNEIEGQLPEDLNEFLNSENKPVYVGFGSVSIKKAANFIDVLCEASRKSGTRIILGSGWAGLGDNVNLKNIHIAKETPHLTLFKKVAAVIHHGGSGTTHTAAKAGVPQFILPQIADQFYWAGRTFDLGLGPKPVVPSKISTEKLTSILTDLRQNPKYSENAKNLALDISRETPISSIMNLVKKHEKSHDKIHKNSGKEFLVSP